MTSLHIHIHFLILHTPSSSVIQVEACHLDSIQVRIKIRSFVRHSFFRQEIGYDYLVHQCQDETDEQQSLLPETDQVLSRGEMIFFPLERSVEGNAHVCTWTYLPKSNFYMHPFLPFCKSKNGIREPLLTRCILPRILITSSAYCCSGTSLDKVVN